MKVRYDEKHDIAYIRFAIAPWEHAVRNSVEQGLEPTASSSRGAPAVGSGSRLA